MTTMEIKEMEARAGFVPGQLADSTSVRGAVIAFDEHCQTHVHCHSPLLGGYLCIPQRSHFLLFPFLLSPYIQTPRRILWKLQSKAASVRVILMCVSVAAGGFGCSLTALAAFCVS